MGKLITENKITSDNVSSITHVESGGTITEVTDIDKVITRSVLDEYEFTFSSLFGIKTLTINLSSSTQIEGVAVFGMKTGGDINSIALRSGGTLLSSCTEVQRQTRTVGGKVVDDFFWTADSDVGGICNRIDIVWVNEDTGDGYIGSVLAGAALHDFKVKPTIGYTFEESGNKLRSEGGQMYGTHDGSYKVATFQTTAMPSTRFTNGLNNINYNAGKSGVIAFVPNEDDELIIYGTQRKLFSIKTILGQQEDENLDVKWLQEGSFVLEEEF